MVRDPRDLSYRRTEFHALALSRLHCHYTHDVLAGETVFEFEHPAGEETVTGGEAVPITSCYSLAATSPHVDRWAVRP